MYHYTYLLEFDDGMKYVGVHSTHIKPHLDARYLGSGRMLPPRDPGSCTKTILGIHPDRCSALEAEKAYIIAHDCCNSATFYNLRVSTFDLHGRTKEDTPGIAEAAEKLRGRKWVAPPTSAVRLKGDARTPAQKDGQARMRKALTGRKDPKKAHKGTKNSGFRPWYYITPEGEYVEVHDRTKAEVAPELGLTRRQLTHGFHHSNMHKRAKTLPRKGYTFGDLPRPDDADIE